MIKTGIELAEAARNAAQNHKTLYVLGCIGAPLNSANKIRYTRNLPFNARQDRAKKIHDASADTFGFDCVCFVKSLLWGWDGDPGKVYGGATYASRKVPDVDANEMIRRCTGISRGFTQIQPGEVLWIPDHIGIYLGDGLAAECTSRWKDGVQITAVHNIREIPGRNGRTWEKHGMLPWVCYTQQNAAPEPPRPRELPAVGYGSRGESTRALQLLLIGRGCSCGSAGADGICGAATVSAVKAYQEDHGLTCDGIAGKATWGSLLGL